MTEDNMMEKTTTYERACVAMLHAAMQLRKSASARGRFIINASYILSLMFPEIKKEQALEDLISMKKSMDKFDPTFKAMMN